MFMSGVKTHTLVIIVIVQLMEVRIVARVQVGSTVGAAGTAVPALAVLRIAAISTRALAFSILACALRDQTNSVLLIEGNYTNG